MSNAKASLTWKPEISKAEGPAYLAIANALGNDILEGNLAAGVRLPPQRALAQALGLDFTTISRAYAEARQKGLVEARVGQGTYVRSIQSSPKVSSTPGLIDMAMNQPPLIDNAALQTKINQSFASFSSRSSQDLLSHYQIAGGTERDRKAGLAWLAPRVNSAEIDRLILAPGAQGALLSILTMLASAGDMVCTEEKTYPGMRALAAQFRINLAPIAMDEDGIIPDAFEEICKTQSPKALYCTPTLQNPTTITMPAERRQQIAAIAQTYSIPIIEDDAYGAIPSKALPTLADFAPDLTYHIASLAKCVSPALRIAYILAPDTRSTARLVSSLRATACMASPLTASLATQWIEDGTAHDMLGAIRKESQIRQKIAEHYLPTDLILSDSEGFHSWLSLPVPWTRSEFIAQLRHAGVSVVGSDAFCDTAPPEAVRLGLGSPQTQEDLENSLQIIADLLTRQPALSNMVV